MIGDIDELRVFAQIAQLGSMAAAARAMGLPANTVSRRLASLEAAVDRTLVIRTTRRLELSEEGRRFYDHTRRILATVQDAEDDLQSGGRLRGRLRLGLGTATAGPQLLRRIATLLHDNPELSVALHLSDEPPDIVRDGIDIAVVAGEQVDSSLVTTRLTNIYAGLGAHKSYIARAGCPRRREDLAQHQCLLFGGRRPSGVWRLTDRRGQHHDVAVGGRFVSNSSRVLFDALLAGVGIGLHSLPFAQRTRLSRDIVRVLPSYRFGPLPIYAVMPKGVSRTAPVRAILEILREEVGRGSTLMRWSQIVGGNPP